MTGRQTPATTYHHAEERHPSIQASQERFEELATREMLARAAETLTASGEEDAARKVAADRWKPLTVAEHLEMVAAGEVVARYYRHPAQVHRTIMAGATWQEVAEATGRSEDMARADYIQWSAGQHQLWADTKGQIGLGDAEYAEAVQRAGMRTEPQLEAGQ